MSHGCRLLPFRISVRKETDGSRTVVILTQSRRPPGRLDDDQ